jgi:hypothetical protein
MDAALSDAVRIFDTQKKATALACIRWRPLGFASLCVARARPLYLRLLGSNHAAFPSAPLGGRLSSYTQLVMHCSGPHETREEPHLVSNSLALRADLSSPRHMVLCDDIPRATIDGGNCLVDGPEICDQSFQQADADRAAEGGDMVSSHLNSHPFQHLKLHCIQGKFTAFFK